VSDPAPPVAAAPASARLGARTLRGLAWAYGSYVGGRVLILVSTAILARLLSPKDFGLVSIALIAIALLETFSDLGVAQALIVAPDDELPERASTAFFFSVLLGLLLTVVTAATGPAAAAFFHQPALVGLLPVLGLNFLITSLGTTHYALAQKRIDFRSRTIAEFADVVLRGATSVGLAIAGFGAWSLVLGYLVGTAALTTALWTLIPWRPSLRAPRRHLGSLLRFGGALTVTDILGAVFSNVDYLVVGRVLGASALGLYTLGFRLPELLILNLSHVAAEVLFPAFATVDRRELGRAFLVSLRYLLLLGLPITAAIVVVARPFILAAFGAKWEHSVPVMQVLAVYALAGLVGIPAGTAYKSVGRVGVLIALSVPRALVLFPALALLADRGIVAVAWCMTGSAALIAVIGLVLASRLLAVGGRRIWQASWRALAATAGMTAALVPLERAISSPWPALLACSAAAAAAYGALLLTLARDDVRDLRDRLLARPTRAATS
jgi:O-antigen/teichoic acid export membrane protein